MVDTMTNDEGLVVDERVSWCGCPNAPTLGLRNEVSLRHEEAYRDMFGDTADRKLAAERRPPRPRARRCGECGAAYIEWRTSAKDIEPWCVDCWVHRGNRRPEPENQTYDSAGYYAAQAEEGAGCVDCGDTWDCHSDCDRDDTSLSDAISKAYDAHQAEVLTKVVPQCSLTEEQVEHPQHYTYGQETYYYIASWEMNWAAGNVIKYVTRAPHKGKALSDYKKAAWYLQRLIEDEEKKACGSR
jgi:hypothetical protein